MMAELKDIFFAESVAVVGASASPEKTGYKILKNIIDGGYQGKIYPINPKCDVILDCKCYKSLAEIDSGVDLVVVVVPAAFVPSVMSQAVEAGAKGAVIISGGFKEIGKDDLEVEVMDIARSGNIRVFGPNCQGVNYTPNKMCATWPLIDKRGPIAVISQSGTIGAYIEQQATQDNIGISSFVALGNKADISELDLLPFFAQDENTTCIALNLEGVKDGKAFIEIASEVGKIKPVVVLKPGSTSKGAKAAQSHTKSICGDDSVFTAACERAGIIRTNTVEEFYDTCKICALLGMPEDDGMYVITSSGGSGILAVDTAEKANIRITEPETATLENLRANLPSHCVVSNPLDLTGDAGSDRYAQSISILGNDQGCGLVLAIFGDPIPDAAKYLSQVKDNIRQKLVVCYIGGGAVELKEVPALNNAGIPVFPTPERAVNAISNWLRLRKK